MTRALGWVLVVALAGCSAPNAPRPAYDHPNPFHHYVEWATVAHVEQVEESRRIKREEYLCRKGAGMQVCSTEKRIHQPAGVRVKLLRSDKTVVSFFDTHESSFLVNAKGETVCIEVIDGPFGLIVTAVSPNTRASPCGPGPSAPPKRVSDGLEIFL